VNEETTRSLLDLILINKGELVRDVKIRDSHSCSDHEMVELSGGKNQKSGITFLDCRRANFGLFRDLLGRIPMGDHSGEKRGTVNIVDFQGSPPLSSRMVHPREQDIYQKWQKACTDEKGALTKTQK